jgi:hypothetical protein
MKRLFHTCLLFSSIIFLWGCPYGSPYAIDAEPQQYVDDEMLGKWAAFVQRPSYENEYTEQPVKVIFEKKSEMEYDIAITGYIDELKKFRACDGDTIKGTAFVSVIDGHQFLNAFINGRVYIAEIKKDSTSLNILALSEHFTSKFVKNSEQLRNALSYHYKTRPRPTYDDWFVAKNLQKVN